MFTRIKNWKCNRNFKISQRFFSYFCSFQPYHLKQKSNWCDSPFKGARSHPWVNYSIILPEAYQNMESLPAIQKFRLAVVLFRYGVTVFKFE
jgi:hypothetical protein